MNYKRLTIAERLRVTVRNCEFCFVFFVFLDRGIESRLILYIFLLTQYTKFRIYLLIVLNFDLGFEISSRFIDSGNRKCDFLHAIFQTSASFHLYVSTIAVANRKTEKRNSVWFHIEPLEIQKNLTKNAKMEKF